MRKNKYIRLLTILLITIIATILVCNIYRNYENNKLNNSYIAKYVTNISINDLSNAIVESGNNTFVYFGVTGDDNFYKMEKELKKSVINYHMEDEFSYQYQIIHLLWKPSFYLHLHIKIHLPYDSLFKKW